jgi:hypothetical protein
MSANSWLNSRRSHLKKISNFSSCGRQISEMYRYLFNLYVALGARDGIAFDFSGILTKGHFQRSHRRQAGKIRLNYKDWWTRMRGPQVGSD